MKLYGLLVVVDMKLVNFSTCLTSKSTCELLGDGTVDGKCNKEGKTREVADIWMYHISDTSVEIFFQLGCDMLW